MPRVNLKPGASLLAAFSLLQILVGVAITAFFVDFDLSTIQFWQVALYALVTYLAARFYDISENRRIGSNMEGLLFLPGLFLLSPAEVILGRVVGGYFGDRDKCGSFYKSLFTSSAQLMVIATISAVVARLFPDRNLATTTLRDVALAGLIVFVLYEMFVPVWTTTFSLGYFGHLNRRILQDGRATQIVIVVEFVIGVLFTMAMATSPWMFAPIIAVAGLIMYLSLRSARHWVLRTGMDHVLELTRSANSTSDPNETFTSVRQAVASFVSVEDVVIAHIDTDDTISFEPQPGPVIAREASSGARLRTLARYGSLSTAATASRAGAVGVWRLSETTEDYLIAYSDRKMVSLRNIWQAVDILSQHAALVHTTTSQRAALERQAKAAHRKARTDEITAMPNRVGLIEWLEERLSGDQRLVLVAVRVHGLADLQQVLGEQAANSDLCDFVDRVLATEGFDFVARVRDDVFVLVSTQEIDGVTRAVQRIVASDQHQSDSVRAVAAGIVEVNTASAEGAEGLLSDCWASLARAEREKLKVARFDDDDAAAARRRYAIGKALNQAIEEGQIVPFFQPQIDITTGGLIGCEVLARWIHPELGFVSPVEFIEVAEQGNMIEPLTECMLAAALAARTRWMNTGLDVQMSVNISARSLLQPAFIEHISALFARSGLGAGDLTVEITESTIAEDDAMTSASLELLHRIGATISIDDFGTGYSALAYLHRLPVDEVKIDKSMVMALGQERDPTDVVEGLIKICHRLGIRVVAEGVETDDALARLAELDCDIGQGYFFAKPMNEHDWVTWALARPQPTGIQAVEQQVSVLPPRRRSRGETSRGCVSFR